MELLFKIILVLYILFSLANDFRHYFCGIKNYRRFLHFIRKGKDMLCLSRKVEESILIGNDIEIKILRVKSNGEIVLGINAPKSIPIIRKELLEIGRISVSSDGIIKSVTYNEGRKIVSGAFRFISDGSIEEITIKELEKEGLIK